jgi:membrane-bound serine protease (ClpP class)
MSTAQKAALGIGIAVIALMGIFQPWNLTLDPHDNGGSGVHSANPAGYAPILEPPKPPEAQAQTAPQWKEAPAVLNDDAEVCLAPDSRPPQEPASPTLIDLGPAPGPVSPHRLHADRLVLTDGRVIEGTVTREDDRTLTLEIRKVGMSLTTTIYKSEIKTRNTPVCEGQPYVVIPVHGAIGDDVTADALRAGLAEARLAKPQYVILEIDSPGGSIGQMMEMLDLLNKAASDLKIIAYVKRAYSAAAVIAMSCSQVYMQPGATIGATVPFRMTDSGPADVDAKFRSVVEAQMRSANHRGGHADLLIRGMSEIDLELYLTVDDGKPTLRTSGPGKIVKSKGRILTLTTDEAVACGLAHAAPTMADLGKLVCGGAWYAVNRLAYDTTIATVAMQRQEEREAIEKGQRLIARQKAIAEIKPQLDDITRRYAQLLAKAVANDDEIARHTTQCDAELRQIQVDQQRAIDFARYQAFPTEALARAAEVANTRASAARQSLNVQVAQLRSESEAAKNEMALLAKMTTCLSANPGRED